MPDLLIELFSEEIPARMQKKARADLQKLMTDGLVEAGLTYAYARAYATPRRLTLAVEGLSAESPTTREERKGPRADAPEKALEGFLRSTGLSKDQLELRDDKKGQVYFATVVKEGRPADAIVAEVLEATIRTFPWPKAMRWGAGSLRWVRPLQSILCLLSDEAGARVVAVDVDGIRSGDTTRGHRFMSKGDIAVTGFDDYVAKLKRACVILDQDERTQAIWHDATTQAFAKGLEVVEDPGLLDEVAGLVEWPVVLMGEIGQDFLHLPAEVLQTSMKEHQKFFSVKRAGAADGNDQIVGFVTVANRETADDGATILAGNQKVLAARLGDAKFFWENDLRVAHAGMQDWLHALEAVTFHNKLGTQAARLARLTELSRRLAAFTGAEPDLAAQAAQVAKADLASEMVYEFPELQGVMGRYYSEAAGLDSAVAAACAAHYSPLGPSDDVPTAPVSVTVALADKLDMLTGFWAIDEKPTGSKDPFALRRAALGVIRLVLVNDLRLPLEQVIDQLLLKHEIADHLDTAAERELFFAHRLVDEIASFAVFGAAFRALRDKFDADEEDPLEITDGSWLRKIEALIPTESADLIGFFHDRLKVFLRDEGIRHDVIDACLALPGSDDICLLVKRARALQAVLSTEDGENLIQGVKRATNILTQAEDKDGVEYSFGADVKFAEAAEEKALFDALAKAQALIEPAIAAEDFAGAMAAMADLRGPIDAFFEAVQVNADNDIVRRNRLNLLGRIRAVCGQVADLHRIEG